MPRTDLSRLLQTIDTDVVEPLKPPIEPPRTPEPSPAEVAPTTEAAPARPAGSPRKPRSTRAKTESSTAPAVSDPLYLRLVRKETRLREEQYETLTEYARKLNRAKAPGTGERITENTLIRIAIDLLIPHLDEMTGSDESQLRKSVSNRV